jgi:hypothetical protein
LIEYRDEAQGRTLVRQDKQLMDAAYRARLIARGISSDSSQGWGAVLRQTSRTAVALMRAEQSAGRLASARDGACDESGSGRDAIIASAHEHHTGAAHPVIGAGRAAQLGS